MALARQQEGRNGLVTTSMDTILVTACGRSVQVNHRDAQTTASLKGVLQRSLNMHGQEFELYDCCGNMLLTDGDLRDAVGKGMTPFTATLSESSIHYIENRREELSQMQWKLLRDKVDGLASKVNVLTQQLSQISDGLTTQQMEMQESDRKLGVEIDKANENAKEQTRQLGAQLAERVEAVAQILHSERNMREALKEGIGRQVQGVKDALEGDRCTRKTEMASTSQIIEQLRRDLLEEGSKREQLEERFHQDLNTLQDRIDTHARYQAEAKQDIEHYMKNITTEANRELENNTRKVLELRTKVDTSEVQYGTRLKKIEDKSDQLERSLSEQMSRAKTQINQLLAKTNTLKCTVEAVRLEERAEKLNLNSNSVPEIADEIVSELRQTREAAGSSFSELGTSSQTMSGRRFVSGGGSMQVPPGSYSQGIIITQQPQQNSRVSNGSALAMQGLAPQTVNVLQYSKSVSGRAFSPTSSRG